ncbi:Uma2 family endonuclease [Thermomicrobium sp. 4228-Ro]|uniref:Uma2 family endonuclease n=1 Tax=Thermomicrobium sp. 4228-Ro TaxID=2993937 RepID=UPI00224935B4|nr:Uma2 family endonuclease [Thermomicrobium sp. 4228-Ro]MCX2728234.1 Uma2 family endonuclease [Thermomicrobium sp. 4228-Ro]
MQAIGQQEHLLTVDDLVALPERPGIRYELHEGKLVEMPGAGGIHAAIVVRLVLLLHQFVTSRRLGFVFGDGLGYILRRNPDTVRIPDVSVVRRERVPAGGIPEGFWPGAPDLAVDIVSPHDRAEEVHERVRDYLGAGTRLVWVLWPKSRTVTVYWPDGTARELGPDEKLTGGDVLPGFEVSVSELFLVPAEESPGK